VRLIEGMSSWFRQRILLLLIETQAINQLSLLRITRCWSYLEKLIMRCFEMVCRLSGILSVTSTSLPCDPDVSKKRYLRKIHKDMQMEEVVSAKSDSAEVRTRDLQWSHCL
jgi:hypothetical protein